VEEAGRERRRRGCWRRLGHWGRRKEATGGGVRPPRGGKEEGAVGMQKAAFTPRMSDGRGATTKRAKVCSICWTGYSEDSICILRLQLALQNLLEIVLISC
jgi:hypothetical protein